MNTRLLVAIVFLLLRVGSTWAAPPPVKLVSPVGKGIAGVLSECPTFSWSASTSAEGYRLVIYDARAGASLDRSSPLFEIDLPAGVAAFAPTVEHCLRPGHRYGWAVAARIDGALHWSEPALFVVVARPPDQAEPLRRQVAGETRTAPARPYPTAGAGFPATVGRNPGPRTSFAAAFSPPECTSMFSDVTPANPLCPWIEQLARDEITAGCGGGNYCPKAPVTREQLALLLERSMRGTNTFRPGSTTADIPNRRPAETPFRLPLDDGADAGVELSITIGVDGLGLVSYYADGDLKVAHCSDVECSAATITPLDTEGNVGRDSSITIGEDGLGLISYRTGDADSDLKVAHCSNVECTVATVTTLDSDDDVGDHTSITIGVDGRGLISYYDATNGDLKVAHCLNAACSAADINAIDTEEFVGQYTSIAIGADGMGLISYLALGGGLKVAHCSNVNCSFADLTTIDPTAGSATSLTIGADGFGLISYDDSGNQDLKVAHCSDVACSGATITPLDTADVSGDTSITVGADGLGLISYHDIANETLKVAHCSNVACSAATFSFFPREVDTEVGTESAITIGADGLPLVAYHNESDEDLVVAHCSNVFCIPYFRRR